MKSVDSRSPFQDSLFLGFMKKEVVSILGAVDPADREDTYCTVKTIVGYSISTVFEGGLLCVEE